MRICFVLPRVYSLFNDRVRHQTGGSERQLYYFGKELHRLGDEVHYCVADFGQADIEEHDGLRVWKSFALTDNRLIGFRKLTRTLRRIAADLYVFRSPDVGVLPSLAFVRFVLRKPAVYMLAHDPECGFRALRRSLGLRCAAMMAGVYRIANAIVAQTDGQKREFEHRRRRPIAAVVPNICPLSPDDAPRGGRDGALWVGRCLRSKRPEVYLELARRFPQTQFEMICPRSIAPDYWEATRTHAASLPNVTFVAFALPDEIGAHYRKAGLFVMTSDVEGFSNTMMEAMEAACPLLSLSLNPDQILTRHDLGVCADGDTDRFTALFAQLMADPSRRAAMGSNGRRYLAEHHDPAAIAARFRELLQCLVRGANPAGGTTTGACS